MKYPAKIFLMKTGGGKSWIIPLLVLVVFLGFLISAEALILAFHQAGYYPVENYGTGNKFLEHRIAQLERFVADNGRIDYLVVGNSTTGDAVDCFVAGRRYREITGKPLSCFNFGFAGNTSEFLPVLFRILREDYSPEKFVFDISGPYQRNNVQQQNSRWLRYRGGDFNLNGWMVEQFRFMRVFLGLRHWMEQPGEFNQLARAAAKPVGRVSFTSRDEYNSSNIKLLENAAAGRKERSDSPAKSRREARIFADESKAFTELIEQVGPDRMIFFKVPVSLRVKGGMRNLAERSQREAELARKYGIPLMEVPDLEIFSEGNWKDDGVHMTGSGRWKFSEWLGEALARQEGFVPEVVVRFPEKEKK